MAAGRRSQAGRPPPLRSGPAGEAMEDNARGRRNQRRTERNYYIGSRYRREKLKLGGDRGNQHVGGRGKKVPSADSSAVEIGLQEGCSDRHVKNCAKLAAKIDEAVSYGLSFLKWPVLTERIKCNPKLIDELIYLGAGGCREQIERLLALQGLHPHRPRCARVPPISFPFRPLRTRPRAVAISPCLSDPSREAPLADRHPHPSAPAPASDPPAGGGIFRFS